MGAVYRAFDVKCDRKVALKVIRPDLGANPEFAERFAREAKTAARVKHPGLVEVSSTRRRTGSPWTTPAAGSPAPTSRSTDAAAQPIQS
jgi:serine/threonine protein kinase